MKKEKTNPDVELTKAQQAIVDNEDMKKSDKFRALHKDGISIGQITRIFESYYSFVQSAVTRDMTPKEPKPKAEKAVKEKASTKKTAKVAEEVEG